MAQSKKQKKNQEEATVIYYKLTEQSLPRLEKEKIPSEILGKLETCLFEEHKKPNSLMRCVRKALGPEAASKYEAAILKVAEQKEKKAKDYYTAFIVTEAVLKKLANDNLPPDVLSKLERMKNERFNNEKKFLKILNKKIFTRSLKRRFDRSEITKYTWTVVERAKKKVSPVSYILTEKSLARLKGKIAADLLNRIKSLTDKKFARRQDFEKALNEITDRKLGVLDKMLILWQAKVFKLSSFIITDESLQELEDIAPADVHSQLATLKNTPFFTKFSFRKRLTSLISREQYQRYKSLVYDYSKTIYRETIESLVVAFLAAMILRMFVIQAFRIPTGSMKDTLLIGDFLLVNKFVYGVRTPDRIPLVDIQIPHFRLPVIREPKRGDIIVFKYPREPKLDYIKRCVALPGQTVEIRNGLLYVDGQPEGEITPLPHRKKYDKEEGTIVHYFQVKLDNGKKYVIRHFDGWENENFGPITVEPGHYFMMGDNRDNSADSRSWGSLPRDNIVGEALIIYFSWDQNLIIYPWYRIVNKIRWGRLADLIR